MARKQPVKRGPRPPKPTQTKAAEPITEQPTEQPKTRPPLKGLEHLLAGPLLVAAAAIYLGATFLGATGSKLTRSLPASLQYFTQTACLFPRAARAIIDYRAEGYVCGAGWRELDTRLDFFINADDKESRFYRTLFFFRRNQAAMESLETYLVTRHNARATEANEPAIVGVRFSSLRLPLPEPGEHRPWEQRPFAEYPPEQQKRWYETPRAELRAACEAGR